MINVKITASIGLLMIGMSCSNSTSKDKENQPQKEIILQKAETPKGHRIQADVANSQLVWKGHKIMGSHEGEMDLKSGYLIKNKNTITGGEFVVDMHSIRAKKLMDGGDDHDKNELAAHLRDGDFFDASTYPTAKFIVTKAENSDGKLKISGNMTIKAVTQPISFLATWTNDVLKANVNIDRTKFNIKYGSGSFFDNLGDRAIKDQFSLDLNVVFKQ